MALEPIKRLQFTDLDKARVQAEDARCGEGSCELVSFVDWPIARAQRVELTRAD